MPPKKKADAPSKKTVEKKKDKVIEDKTFGLKNKKGKKQQDFIKNVSTQVKHGGTQTKDKLASMEHLSKKEKEMMKEELDLRNVLKPVAAVQRISKDADPKSVLCVFFKQGQCTKGDKCKFSHDLSLERKTEKRNLYVDSREVSLENDTIDKWDESKLQEVVDMKHGAEKGKPKTEIVCRHFLQAIEKGLYGWFWACPGGGDKCIYRHALPPGFIFKKPKNEDEVEDIITIEELVEQERRKLTTSDKALTRVTLETFLRWKDRKLKEKREKEAAAFAKRKEAFTTGKSLGVSGREVFEFNPSLVMEDDDDNEGEVFVHLAEEQESEGVDLTNFTAASHMGCDDEQLGAVGGAALTEKDVEQPMAIDEELFQEEFADDDVPIDEDLFSQEVDDICLDDDD